MGRKAAMKSAITICLVPEAKSGPFVFHGDLEQGCRKAAELGFDAVEVFAPSGSSPLLSPLRSLLQTYSLSLAAVGTGAGWLCHQWSLASADHETRSHALQFIESIIDFAGDLGAPAIVGSMQGRVLPGKIAANVFNGLKKDWQLSRNGPSIGTSLSFMNH